VADEDVEVPVALEEGFAAVVVVGFADAVDTEAVDGAGTIRTIEDPIGHMKT
jgi:hypothetical protein